MNFIKVLAGVLATTPLLDAASVTVFLDNGTTAPGSTNGAIPFTNNTRESVWDITSTAESGLAALGAAVMEIRMVTLNVNGDSRRATTAGGNGLGVDTGSNNNWIDGNSREAGLFQFTLYSDVGKTVELTGLSFTLTAVISRQTNDADHLIDAFAGSGALTFDDGASGSIGTPADNSSNIYLGGSLLTAANDGTNSSTSDTGIISGSLSGAAPAFYTTASSGVSFGDDDSFWLRRRNAVAGDAAYQLGGFTLNVVPEPTAPTLIGLGGLMLLLRRRRA